MKLSRPEAKTLLLRHQLLAGGKKLPKGMVGAARIIEHLGYVQIDTISVIERAHHHVLWTRQPGYGQQMLHEMQAVDRTIFEYWGHAMCYLPMADYRYYLPLMARFPGKGAWEKSRYKQHGHLMAAVLERIKNEGPLCSKDFESPPKFRRGPWWDWKPAKTALELLYWKGDLMVSERRNFQKYYNLTERVLPAGTDTAVPDGLACGRFIVRRALGALGLATEREIWDYIHVADRATVKRAIDEMAAGNEIMPVAVDGIEAGYFALPHSLNAKPKKSAPGIHLLSPFDNLIIHRLRVKNIFGFDYALECYTPSHKRTHGYFTLPILFGDAIIGRLDPKAERAEQKLVIRSLRFEPGFSGYDAALPLLTQKLRDLAAFNQCVSVTVERVIPSKLKPTINTYLKNIPAVHGN